MGSSASGRWRSALDCFELLSPREWETYQGRRVACMGMGLFGPCRHVGVGELISAEACWPVVKGLDSKTEQCKARRL